MTFYKYKMLSESDQLDTVFFKGRFLDIKIEGNNKIVLYALDLVFVEVVWKIKKRTLSALQHLNAHPNHSY